ncbi:MAG: PhnA protein [Bacteroidota bacterium]|nr:PhnA protein [Bacteroidota bacterium]
MEERNVKDSNDNTLSDGDSVLLIKSLKVKGGNVTLKQGTLIKKIKLTDNDEEVDCKVDGMSIVLKTEFLKKKS